MIINLLLQFNTSKKEFFKFSNLSDLVIFKSGVDSKNNISNIDDKEAIPWIKLGDIKNDKIDFNKCDYLVNESKNIAKKNDLLVCWSTNPGYSIFIEKESLFSTAFYKIENNEKHVKNTFLHLWFQKYKKIIEMKSVGSTLKKINMKLFGSILISYPSIQEQTKIATFFTLLDKQIQLIERKLELYQLRKKYYLNNMFCDDNSNLPKLRFNGFNEKMIDDKIRNIVSWMRSGGTPKSDNPEFYLGEIPFISIPDMKNKYLFQSKKYISELGLNNSSSYLITKNSILLSAYATIGEICINKIDVALPQSILGIKPNDNIDLEYLYYLMKSAKFKFIKLQQIGSQPNISLDIVKNVKLWITFSSNEQIKIAKFFSQLDESIQNIKKAKNRLNKRKTYYLNNMFV